MLLPWLRRVARGDGALLTGGVALVLPLPPKARFCLLDFLAPSLAFLRKHISTGVHKCTCIQTCAHAYTHSCTWIYMCTCKYMNTRTHGTHVCTR